MSQAILYNLDEALIDRLLLTPEKSYGYVQCY